MLDYKLIEALAIVCREGGFERAAKVLMLTQSAVSQRVRLLEDQLGSPLIIRGNPPRPTQVGSRLIAQYGKVLQLERDLSDDLHLTHNGDFLSLPIGVNEDSMATWFMEAIAGLARDHNFTLHISVDDQDETHKLLKQGEVLGCVSAKSQPLKGCSTAYLGRIDYHCLANIDFATKWFPGGIDAESVKYAPAVIYSTKDRMHDRFLEERMGIGPTSYPHHFIPSSHGFLNAISRGLGYGLVPHLQSEELLASEDVINLSPKTSLHNHLYWHHWDLEAGPIKELTQALVAYARGQFPQGDG